MTSWGRYILPTKFLGVLSNNWWEVCQEEWHICSLWIWLGSPMDWRLTLLCRQWRIPPETSCFLCQGHLDWVGYGRLLLENRLAIDGTTATIHTSTLHQETMPDASLLYIKAITLTASAFCTETMSEPCHIYARDQIVAAWVWHIPNLIKIAFSAFLYKFG